MADFLSKLPLMLGYPVDPVKIPTGVLSAEAKNEWKRQVE